MIGAGGQDVIFGAARVPLGPVKASVRALLQRSTDRDPDESVDEVIASVERGDAVLWLSTRGGDLLAACVTSIIETASGRQCFINHCAGEALRHGTRFLPIILDWAKGEGCNSAELVGRKGWERVLPDFEVKAVVLRREI